MNITETNQGYEVETMPEDLVGANEHTLYVIGEWCGPEPDVGLPRAWFEINDIRNPDGISVMKHLEDDDWFLSVSEQINREYGNDYQLTPRR